MRTNSASLAQSLLCAGLSCAAPALLAAPSWAGSSNGPHTLSVLGSNVAMYFDTIDPSAENDANRVERIIFYPENYSNYVALDSESGPKACGDPIAYFGEAVGYPDTATAPLMVAGGTHASWTSTSNSRQNVAQAKTFTGVQTCGTVHEDGLTRTVYTLKGKFTNSIAIKRTFRFNGGLGNVANSGLRAYVPRFNSLFHYVLLPNAAGNVVRYDANNCVSSPCAITDWNGKWFAEDDGFDEGLFVIRDPSSTTPAFVGIQSSPAGANYTSIVLMQPSSGWSGILTETESICFYSQNVWNQGPTLPKTCPQQTN